MPAPRTAWARRRFQRHLTVQGVTCRISEPGTPIPDGRGGTTPGTPVVTYAAAPCALKLNQGTDLLVAGAAQQLGKYTLYLPATVTLSSKAVIAVTGATTTLRVKYLPDVLLSDVVRAVQVDERTSGAT